MDIQEIEQLVKLVKDAKISELTISTSDSASPSRVSIHKNLKEKQTIHPVRKSEKKIDHTEQHKLKNAEADQSIYITAPIVGIFHEVSGIGIIGTSISKGQIVGHIESMRLMNDVISDKNGIITEIYIEDGLPVEFGQHLYKIEQR